MTDGQAEFSNHILFSVCVCCSDESYTTDIDIDIDKEAHSPSMDSGSAVLSEDENSVITADPYIEGNVIEKADTPCPDCGSPIYRIRKRDGGTYLAHPNRQKRNMELETGLHCPATFLDEWTMEQYGRQKQEEKKREAELLAVEQRRQAQIKEIKEREQRRDKAFRDFPRLEELNDLIASANISLLKLKVEGGKEKDREHLQERIDGLAKEYNELAEIAGLQP